MHCRRMHCSRAARGDVPTSLPHVRCTACDVSDLCMHARPQLIPPGASRWWPGAGCDFRGSMRAYLFGHVRSLRLHHAGRSVLIAMRGSVPCGATCPNGHAGLRAMRGSVPCGSVSPYCHAGCRSGNSRSNTSAFSGLLNSPDKSIAAVSYNACYISDTRMLIESSRF